MQLGTWTIPSLPIAAVAVAVILVVLVLWGVFRARRTPPQIAAPSRQAAVPAEEAHPCAADWTGEAASGWPEPPAPEPAPAPAPRRTVADAVAERRASVVPAMAGAGAYAPGVTADHDAARVTTSGPELATEEDGTAAAAAAASPTARSTPRAVPTDDTTPVARTSTDAPTDDSAPVASATTEALADGATPGAAATGAVAAGGLLAAAGRHELRDEPVSERDGEPENEPGKAHSGEPGKALGGEPGEALSDVPGTALGDERGDERSDEAGNELRSERSAESGNEPTAAVTDRLRPSPVPQTASQTDGLLAPIDEQPDAATLAALREPDGPATDATTTRQASVHAEISTGTPAGTRTEPPAETPAETTDPTGTWATIPEPTAVPDPRDALPETEAAPAPVPPPWSAARTESSDTGSDPDEAPGTERSGDTDEAGDDPDRPGTGHPAYRPVPVSRAVQQALAARAVQRARQHRDDAEPDERPSTPVAEPTREQPLTVVPSARRAPAGEGDARDRLLSVLLQDPARAVGAAEDLDEAQDRIEQLGDVLRRRRADLAAAVCRLHESGLDREQIGRLAGLTHDDVRAILDARTGDGADGPRPG